MVFTSSVTSCKETVQVLTEAGIDPLAVHKEVPFDSHWTCEIGKSRVAFPRVAVLFRGVRCRFRGVGRR
eukprot:1348338-Rhodomonas_salina.2